MTSLQHRQFEAAKQVALTITEGHARRAKLDGVTTNYLGYKDDYGNMWVLADNATDIDNANDADRIEGKYGVMVIAK